MFAESRPVAIPLNDCCGQKPRAETLDGCMTRDTMIKCLICGREVWDWDVYDHEKDSEVSAAEKWNAGARELS